MRYVYLVICSLLLFSCKSNNEEIKNNIQQMRSSPIIIPYGEMECWTTDSLLKIAPWENAKIKLVHYVDSAKCSTCYLGKIIIFEEFLQLENDYHGLFCNIFIANPNKKDLFRLKIEHMNNRLPQTVFIDTTHAFLSRNHNIPDETIYHTFLLDENNKIILVGNPIFNENIKKKAKRLIADRISKLK